MTASRGRTLTDEGATFWLSKDGWDSEESNWLLHGLDPRHQVSIATIGGRRTILPPMAPDDDLAALIARAYESGALRPYAEPSAVFAWAISKGIRTPAQFATKAMSQQERRKALDAAGLTHVSAAPEPLEAVRSTGYTKPRNSPPPIDWDHWRYMPEVTLGDAVALSLGENPELFDVDDPSEAFEKRLKIAVSNARTGRLQLVMLYNNERVSPVLLANFVAWAKGLNLPNMPPEFLALTEQSTGQGSTPGPVSSGSAKPSKDMAMEPKTASKSIGHGQSAGTPKFNMTKAALVKAHKHEWPTIEGDLAHASENGLAAAKAGTRDWYEAAAMDWARAKGKLTDTAKPKDALTQATHNMASLQAHVHRQKR